MAGGGKSVVLVDRVSLRSPEMVSRILRMLNVCVAISRTLALGPLLLLLLGSSVRRCLPNINARPFS